MEKLSGIYQIKNIINAHRYIGSSTELTRRLQQHRSDLRCNRHFNAHLQNAWNKYGENSFVMEIILLCNKGDTIKYEQILLDRTHNEYNFAKDATAPMLGKRHTKEALAKISNASKNISDETRAKISAAGLGRKHTEESKRKISASKIGHGVSKETRIKISRSKVGKRLSKEHRQKLCEAQRRRHE